MDVVFHGQFVLYHVGIRIDGLLGIFGQLAVADDGRSPIVVFARCP